MITKRQRKHAIEINALYERTAKLGRWLETKALLTSSEAFDIARAITTGDWSKELRDYQKPK